MATRATSKPEMAIAVIDALKLNTSPGLPAAVEAAITTAVKNALL
jgi:hypothetical protein